MTTKTCTKCGEAKPLTEYGKHKKSKDGLNQRCLPCQRAARRESAARAMQDPERKAATRRYQAEWNRQWRRQNPDAAHEKSVSDYRRNLERSRQQSRESERRRRTAKPDDVRAIARRAYRKAQQETADKADRSGAPWSDAEDVVVMDRSKSCATVAKDLGRSLAAVVARRVVLEGKRDWRIQYERERAKTVPKAVNWGKLWTGPQLELISDYSRSAFELALMLGRTPEAVEAQRGLLRRDPRKAWLAGGSGALHP